MQARTFLAGLATSAVAVSVLALTAVPASAVYTRIPTTRPTGPASLRTWSESGPTPPSAS